MRIRHRHDARHGDGPVGPKELFDGGGYETGVGDEALAVVGMGGEVPQARAERTPCGVDAGDQEHEARTEDVPVVEGCAKEGLGGGQGSLSSDWMNSSAVLSFDQLSIWAARLSNCASGLA